MSAPRNPKALAIMRELQAIALAVPREIADVFVDWMPHISSVYIRCHTGGWVDAVEPALVANAYVDGESHDGAQDLLDRLKKYLSDLGYEVRAPDPSPSVELREVAASVSPELRRETLAGMVLPSLVGMFPDTAAREAVKHADALLAELARTPTTAPTHSEQTAMPPGVTLGAPLDESGSL